MAIRSTNHYVSMDSSISYLSCDVLPAKPNHKPIFWGIIFVFVLEHQGFPLLVVRFALSAPLEFHLVAAKVGATF